MSFEAFYGLIMRVCPRRFNASATIVAVKVVKLGKSSRKVGSRQRPI